MQARRAQDQLGTRRPSHFPDVLQRKSAAGPPKTRFGNHPPIRPDHASSSRRIPRVRRVRSDSRL